MEAIYHSCNAQFFGYPKLGLLLHDGPDEPRGLGEKPELQLLQATGQAHIHTMSSGRLVGRYTEDDHHALTIQVVWNNDISHRFVLERCRWFHFTTDDPCTVTIKAGILPLLYGKVPIAE